MRKKNRDFKVADRELYQKARDQVLLTISIPQYMKDNIDPEIDLEIKDRCLCPFHVENTPSFRYNRGENYWQCFGACKIGGTVIELHMHKYGLPDHFEALADLKKQYGNKYGLTFKNFWLESDNKDLSIEDILRPQKPTMELNDFLKPKSDSVYLLSNNIEKALRQLKEKNLNEYIEMCIEYDNLKVYHTYNDKTLGLILRKITSKLY